MIVIRPRSRSQSRSQSGSLQPSSSGLLLPSAQANVAFCVLFSQTAFAVKPTVKTVPWVASNPLIAHDTFGGKQITLKGTADVQATNFQWIWDFGDGTAVASGTVSNKYVIEATHAYSGSPGQIFTAQLSVQDMNTGEKGSNLYLVEIRAKSLQIEANIAMDEALWYLHKTQNRTTVGVVDLGDWLSGGFAASQYYAVTAANLNAFEVNGHLESGNPNDPYTETVQRGMRNLFNWLTTGAITPKTNGLGTFNPDTNGNGYAVYVNQTYPFYQGGMFIDAIVASGTPGAVASTGPLGAGINPGISGRTYRDIVADLADGYLYCQYTGGAGGGWRYVCGDAPDNSACQWAAIGLIPAQRVFGISIPVIVKNWNKVWLQNSQNSSNGQLGYQDANGSSWGVLATTPAGLVQMAMDGIGRGDARWDKAETFMRDRFGNSISSGPTVAPRAYYYGLFSLVKALLLHDPTGSGVAQPITLLQSSTPGVQPIDWYNAEASAGDPSDGVARTLVTSQSAVGYWTGNDFSADQYPFETAFAVIMLNQTIFASGAPVAVAQANPNPTSSGAQVTLDGTGSFHQDPLRKIVLWQWDFTGGTNFTATGSKVVHPFSGAIGSYPVRLRVTDDAVPAKTADTIINIIISNPPIAPTANSGGPYSFCPQQASFVLDGSKSVNPDDGLHEPGAPGDFITAYQWDLSGKNTFTDADGPSPDVTTLFSTRVGTSFVISLKVTDNTALSFPTSGKPNLSSIDSTQVTMHLPTDAVCSQISLPGNLTVAPGQCVSFPVTLVTPAGPGGVYITLSSGDSSKVAFALTPQNSYLVYIPAGTMVPDRRTPNALVCGVTFGSAAITAAAKGYLSASQSVRVAGTLSLFPSSSTEAGLSKQIRLTLSETYPALPGGLTVSLSSDNPAVATVPPTVTIPANATSVSVPVTGVSFGTTIIHVSGAPNATDAAASVTFLSGIGVGN